MRIKIDKLKAAAHVAALTPLASLIVDGWSSRLTFDPIREITLRTGKDALILLLLTLACAPLARLAGWTPALKLRRILGVYAFVYASLHFLTFVGLDYRFDPGLIYAGIAEKPFALIGFATFLVLLPLAVTSTNGWARRLGKNWKRLHRLIYAAAILDVAHFFWLRLSKLNLGEPLAYTTIAAVLLLLRLVRRKGKSSA